jgi:hypothetical protein
MGKEINDELKPERKQKENTDLLDDFEDEDIE